MRAIGYVLFGLQMIAWLFVFRARRRQAPGIGGSQQPPSCRSRWAQIAFFAFGIPAVIILDISAKGPGLDDAFALVFAALLIAMIMLNKRA